MWWLLKTDMFRFAVNKGAMFQDSPFIWMFEQFNAFTIEAAEMAQAILIMENPQILGWREMVAFPHNCREWLQTVREL